MSRQSYVTTTWQKNIFTFTVNYTVHQIRTPIHCNIAANSVNSIYLGNFGMFYSMNEIEAKKPVIVEAESGDVETELNILHDDTIKYVSIQTRSSAFNPGKRNSGFSK